MKKLRIVAAGLVVLVTAVSVYLAFFRELPGPPGLEAKSTIGTARAIRGSYGWDFGNRSIQADSINPTGFDYKPENILMVTKGENIELFTVYNDKFFKGSFELEDFDIYRIEGETAIPSGGSAEVEGRSIRVIVPEVSGIHVLIVTLKFEQGTVSYGLKISALEEAPMKGLELYIWRDGEKVMYSLLVGTNRNKTEEEIKRNQLATDSTETIRMLLNGYEDSFVTLYQMPDANFTEAEYISIEDELTEDFGHEFNTAGVWSR